LVLQEEYLEALRSGAKMNFNDLIKLINENYNYTPASFINGDLQNSVTENQGLIDWLHKSSSKILFRIRL
jgi:hypothetical protein